jgi:glucosamine--fructose-6-phosphate aminotransferase (isomerizing)
MVPAVPGAVTSGGPRITGMNQRPEWLTDEYPELRDEPPWVMQEMIEAQPELLERIATGSDAAALGLLLKGPGPHTTVGCGTSEHGSLAIAELLTESGTPVVSRQAFEASLEPQEGGVVIGVSHAGETWATMQALQAARAAGSATGLVTAAPDRTASAVADAVLATPFEDKSWCHTIGYTSPIAAGIALAATLSGRAVPASAVAELVAAGVATREAITAIAVEFAGLPRVIVVGSGADRTAARELTLKIEEACHQPTAMRDVETFLHGHLPACGPDTGLVLMLTDRREGDRRAARARILLKAARRVGMRCAAITAADLPAELTDAGQVRVDPGEALSPVAAALLATAPPLQWLAHELAVARGTNPDLIRREQETYREAAAVHE